MARSAPSSPPQPPAEGGTYEVGKDGLVCVQQTAEPTAATSPDPVIITVEPQDDAAAHS